MDVNRSGYYKWKNRQINKPEWVKRRESNLKIIQEVHNKHKTHGYRWISAYLKQKYGKHVTLKNRTSDRIATNPYLNKLYLTVFSELSNSGGNGKKWKLKRYWQRIFGG